MRLIQAIVCISALAVTGTATGASETVRLDLESKRFDRRLPSSQEFVLEVKMPGKEVVRGELDIWPRSESACGTKPPHLVRQHHQLVMIATGTDGERVLRVTVPPLQVQTEFCFYLQVMRGLDEIRAAVIASEVSVAVVKTLDIDENCKNVDVLRSKLRNNVEEKIKNAVSHQKSQAAVQTQAVVIAQIDISADSKAAVPIVGTAVVDGLDLDDLCGKLREATKAKADADEQGRLANEALRQAQDLLRPDEAPPKLLTLNPVTMTLPLLVVGTPPKVDLYRYQAILDQDVLLSTAAQALQETAPDLAVLLRAISDAAVADKPAKRRAFIEVLRQLQPKPAIVTYSHSGSLRTIAMDDLFHIKRLREDTDASVKHRAAEHIRIVMENIELLRSQMAVFEREDKDAAAWFGAFDKLKRADSDVRAARLELEAKIAAVTAARAQFSVKLKERIQSPDIRALVTTVVAIDFVHSVKSSQTDEGASSVSPEVGVMISFPVYATDAWEPWLVPYAGANIYFTRVDRVVPFDELAGERERFRQRFALTVGALLSRPKVNGHAISMAFVDSGLVPMVAAGYRVTSFTRLSAGAFLFDYPDANPAVGESRHGVAFWLGASIDADVWAVVKDKAFE